MLDSFKLNDTEQTKRMKNLVLGDAYFNKEIYTFLSYENLHKLVKKIPKGEIQLPSDLLYGKCVITKEEKFLENIDKYITYVKDHYHIDSMELSLLIEMSFGNKYSNILFSWNDFHKEDNYKDYFDKFRKMFFYNLYSNIMFYSSFVDKNTYSSIIRMANYLERYDYDDEKDMVELEKIFKRIIENRKNNIYNSFVPYKEVKRKEYAFYIHQVGWLLEEYYNNNTIEPFIITNDDNALVTLEGTTIVFNVNDKISSLADDDDVNVDFGIKNKNFDSIEKNIIFRKKELVKLIERLENIRVGEEYEEEYIFINAKLKFLFWCERVNEFLDISFVYKQGSCDYYTLALNPPEIEGLCTLISSQIK